MGVKGNNARSSERNKALSSQGEDRAIGKDSVSGGGCGKWPALDDATGKCKKYRAKRTFSGTHLATEKKNSFWY